MMVDLAPPLPALSLPHGVVQQDHDEAMMPSDDRSEEPSASVDTNSWVDDSRAPQPSPPVNPFHLLSNGQASHDLPSHMQPLVVTEETATEGRVPIHVTKVSQNSVRVVSGQTPPPRGIMSKVTNAFRKDSKGDTLVAAEPEVTMDRSPVMQEPPPSPPSSDFTESEDSHGHSEVFADTASQTSDPPLSPLSEVTEPSTANGGSPSVLTNNNMTAEPADMSPSSPLRPPASLPQAAAHLAVPAPRRISNGSTTSRTGSLAVVRASRLAQQRTTSSPTSTADHDDGRGSASPLDSANEADAPAGGPSRSRQGSSTSLSSMARTTQPQPRVTRRSTNPVVPTVPVTIPPRSSISRSPSRSRTMVPGLEGSELDSDILAHTEQIRRERLERRQKKTSEPEVAPPPPRPEPKRDETKVLVGNLIGEDHVNYVLMYNMLTGIRIGVSRCQAKVKRPLTDEDYLARHKYSFDIVGNELTPSARYDFKFKDYAPWIFRDLREEHFHLDPADYLLSLTAKYILSELGSPGKSGSFFYFSRDYRFIIKTISHSEHKFLRSILKDYHQHVKSNPHTLLSRFYGLHRVKLPRGRKIHFVIMNNLFPPHRDIHETYDLKGSAYGRDYPEEKARTNPKAVLKDKNWVNRGRILEFGPEKRALLTEQLRRDMEFLKKMRVMDYSLLVGIHNMERGNRDNLRENQLTVFHPETHLARRKPSTVKHQSEASHVRKAVRRSDPKMLDAASQLPTADSADRRHFLFYQDEGGMRATDEANNNEDMIYYLGIIDICTPYNTAKKIEHFWKSMTEDRREISCVDPVFYGERFLNFLKSVMRFGDISLRPPGLLPGDPVEGTAKEGATQDDVPQTIITADVTAEPSALSPVSEGPAPPLPLPATASASPSSVSSRALAQHPKSE